MVDIFLRVGLAIIVGALIGLEREHRTGNGLRTMMLICLGAALFTHFGQVYGLAGNDPSRITSGVVTGVGFLGAGMILRHRSGVFGFTTAASVWLVAALGVGIGLGEYEIVAAAAVLVLLVLWGIPYLRQFGGARQTLAYEALGPLDRVRQRELHQLMRTHGLRLTRSTMAKDGGGIRYTWQASGPRSSHEAAMHELITSDIVEECHMLLFDELG